MTTTFPTDDPSWDLEPIFEGGVESEAFSKEADALGEAVGRLKQEIDDLQEIAKRSVDELNADSEQLAQWRTFFDRYFSVRDRLTEAGAFSRCLAAAHADQPEAERMPSRLDDVNTAMRGVAVAISAKFRGVDDEVFAAMVGDERFQDMTLWLKELRRDADQAMDPELERLAVELNRDGLHAWSRLYSQVSGRLNVKLEIDDQTKTYSVGQAKSFLESPDREVRRAAFEGLNKAWKEAAPVCASALHSLIGTEQTLYRRRSGDCLTQPLNSNRVQRSTVEAMLEAAEEFRPLLVRFLKAKAQMLGLKKLDWYDLKAPVAGADAVEEISYEDAQEFIVEQVGQFSPKMADFCRTALAERWVEAEDRPGKSQGGYCTGLPVSKQIRIFMTFGGTSSQVSTLAHELGHGYHGAVMKDLPGSERRVPMGLAETASTFFEALVEQAALKEATGARRLALLDDRLGRSVAFLMNIPARYRLELAMHKQRAEGTLHEKLLSEMTEQLFADAYGDSVASVDEMYWASKLHFFLSSMPFYNFPYTFGYLFSRAVHDRATAVGEEFVETIDELLRDTGRLSSEEVAKKYLNADLGDPAFWTDAAGSLVEDIEQYEELVAAATGA